MSDRVLIVNADDFGLTPGVCRGILRAGAEGVVTSTSALVVAPAFATHAPALRDSGLGVGLHLAVVGEDPPLLSAREVPTLVDERGRLAPTWRHLVTRAARRALDRDDLRREAAAQLEALRGAGIAPTHADAHQNVHLWPLVGSVLAELCRREGIGATRRPRTRRADPTALGVRALGVGLDRRAARAGLAEPAASVGLDEAGGWDVASLVSAVSRVGASAAETAEIAAHPGADPDPDRSRYAWGYAWAQELEALCHPDVAAAVRRTGMRPGTFADLPTVEPDLVGSAFAHAAPRVRAHVAVRRATAPLAELVELVPAGGTVLDVGCGHGVTSLLLARDAARVVHGVDVDRRKVAAARRAVDAAGVGGRVEVEVIDPDWEPPADAYDAVVVADVLYLLGVDRALDLVGRLADAVRPGGRLLVKEMADRPRAKARLNELQEALAVKVLGITAGGGVELVDLDAVAGVARDRGLEVSVRRMDAGYVHPHAVVVADRAAS